MSGPHVRHSTSQWGELIKPSREYTLYGWWQHGGSWCEQRGRTRAHKPFLFTLLQCACTYHLYQKERVAFCLLVEDSDRGRIWLVAHDVLSQRHCFTTIKRLERDFCHQTLPL